VLLSDLDQVPAGVLEDRDVTGPTFVGGALNTRPGPVSLSCVPSSSATPMVMPLLNAPLPCLGT